MRASSPSHRCPSATRPGCSGWSTRSLRKPYRGEDTLRENGGLHYTVTAEASRSVLSGHSVAAAFTLTTGWGTTLGGDRGGWRSEHMAQGRLPFPAV